ncbi:transcriptional regulator, TetR family [Granulicatella balaenopterae]|uniref:Transcriptional regulator, TetR family n=1 Tax=Granulicatella balaenopterae TaxID=137733 RepID=A0A1H9HG22_9LACT|nr:TetR/AcrR family transcriptional regulator [Granulicatella balaenopterae]SEQ61275.1 transcriptional regulator, TetR family [Granulicatella balaenopterae]
MPANFTEEEKERIKQQLYQQGYLLLKQHGMKKMKISELAKSCDIATGTFYNFFPSKKDFIINLIAKRKKESFQAFELLVQNYPQGIPFEETYHYFLDNLLKDNIYQLLTQEEYNSLLKEQELNKNTEEVAQYIMSKLATTKGVKEFLLFAECYKIIIIGSSDLSKLDSQQLEQALSSLVKSSCEILY